MNKDPPLNPSLRAAAEARLAQRPPVTSPRSSTQELLHELRVHQIELEIRNETLREMQAELEVSRDAYVDLFDFAPVGYLLISPAGLIEQVNLTAAQLLGIERSRLLRRRFSRYVAPESGEHWQQHLIRMLHPDGKDACELVMQRGDAACFHARLECMYVVASAPQVRIILSDITARKEAEQTLYTQTEELQERNLELQRFNRAMVGRELDMIALKQDINALSRRLGLDPPYALDGLIPPAILPVPDDSP